MTIEKKKIIIGDGPINCAEIPQRHPVLFAFARENSDHFLTFGHPFKCRDFLNDALISNYFKFKTKIYGYTFDFEKYELTKEFTEMILDFSDCEPECFQFFQDNIHLLQDFEAELGFKKTEVTYLDGHVIFLRADPAWQQLTLSVSFYTLFLRSLTYYNKNSQTFYDFLKALGESYNEDSDEYDEDGEEWNNNSEGNDAYYCNDLVDRVSEERLKKICQFFQYCMEKGTTPTNRVETRADFAANSYAIHNTGLFAHLYLISSIEEDNKYSPFYNKDTDRNMYPGYATAKLFVDYCGGK